MEEERLDKKIEADIEEAGNLKGECNNSADSLPGKAKKRAHVWVRRSVTVCVSIILAAAFVAFTPPGNALAKTINENVVQKLFPPKDVVVSLEGMEEQIPHTPHADSPVEKDSNLSGFVIYIDESSYSMDKADGVTTITPLPVEIDYSQEIADYQEMLKGEGLSKEEIDKRTASYIDEMKEIQNNFPKCKMEITQQENISPEQAAQQEYDKLKDAYSKVMDIQTLTKDTNGIDALMIYADAGTNWDSEVMETVFVDNKKGGTFTIRMQFFLEATEGYGERFFAMLKTFEILDEVNED